MISLYQSESFNSIVIEGIELQLMFASFATLSVFSKVSWKLYHCVIYDMFLYAERTLVSSSKRRKTILGFSMSISH